MDHGRGRRAGSLLLFVVSCLLSSASFPEAEPADGVEYEEADTPTLRYHGCDYAGKRIVFCLDTSLSMRARDKAYAGPGAPEAGDGDPARLEPMRIELAKEELVRVLKGLSPAQEFAVVFFDSGPEGWPEGNALKRATGEAKDAAVAAVRDKAVKFGTDIYGALETAFRFEKVDTIFLLTDGAPYTPKEPEHSDPAKILKRVKEIKKGRKIAVHTLFFAQGAVGEGAAQGGGEKAGKFLKDLAKSNGGTFREVESGAVSRKQPGKK